MAWAYAELAKEAAKLGGPTALRAFYAAGGVIAGSALTLAGTAAHGKWSKRRAAAAELSPETTTDTLAPGDVPEPGHS
ncbi:hypothetical protein ACLQ2E_16820 [Streptomyces lavendulocolor]